MDTGSGVEILVDFAQFEATAANFDLVVGATSEDESVVLGDDEVAGAVSALPAQGGQWGVFFSIFGWI
ncbi:hypothetical protein [Corynebacterium lubricantis]|uniref:hypothetical protein n=1 Tax=Corynebacterium lubricantis TaxID=541095 RepID=UPI0003666DB1|nr:hypothetical protein [Corynebacterium lubricantis]